jgi:hypothetical protein
MDNQIKQKLDSLTYLPKGYTPNLDSKWDTINSALHTKRQTKKSLVLWKRIAAVLILASLGIGYMNWDKQDEPVMKGEARSTLIIYKPIKQIQINTLQSERKTITPHENKSLVAQASQQEYLQTREASILPTFEITEAISQKRNRYIEQDFGDVPSDLPQFAQTENSVQKIPLVRLQLNRKLNTAQSIYNQEDMSKTILSFSHSN